jgi:spermidine synthase
MDDNPDAGISGKNAVISDPPRASSSRRIATSGKRSSATRARAANSDARTEATAANAGTGAADVIADAEISVSNESAASAGASASAANRDYRSPVLLLCFALSGFAGLVCQIAWSKVLGLVFGFSAYATTTVLAVFLCGIALGSRWIGKQCKRFADSVALYAWMEIGIAGTGILSLASLAAVRALYSHAYPVVAASRFLSVGLRIFGAALVLLIPAFLMGGTFPVLSRAARSREQLGTWVSRLYAICALGAVMGTLAAGFLLLPQLGLRGTVLVAAGLHVVAGILALLFSRAQRAGKLASEELQSSEQSAVSEFANELPMSATSLLICLAVLGGVAMAYEISWTRMLATMLGNSVYAFTLILATFLAGIALGSLLFERRLTRTHGIVLRTLASAQTASAAGALLLLIFLQRIPGVIPPILRFTHESFGGVLLAQFLTSAVTMLPVAVLLGFSLPALLLLATRASSTRGTSAEAVGLGYAVSIVGAMLAAVITGVVLVPWIGSYRVVALAGTGNLALAIFLERHSRPRRPRAFVLQAVMLLGLVIAGVSLQLQNRNMASSSPLLYGNFRHRQITLAELADTEDVVFFEDGLNATVSVVRSDDYVALKSNGIIEASNVDESTQVLLGDLGAIFHAHPKRVLIIGFGGGMTASAVARFPEVERIDCIESEPAVLDAANDLAGLNRGILADPRLHLILDDPRNAVQSLRSSYDVIISEPANAWSAGVASLYTGEFYETLRKRLAPGGVMVQWIEGYSLAVEDLRMILASLAPHFVDVSLWHSGGDDFLVLARTEDSQLDLDRSRALWSNAPLQQDFRTLRLTQPESWPVYFRLSDREVREFAMGARRNSDDRPSLEFLAPKTLLRENVKKVLESSVAAMQKELLPSELKPRERRAALQASAESAVEQNSGNAKNLVQALQKLPATASLEILRGRFSLLEGKAMEASEHFEKAMTRMDNYYQSQYWLAIAQHLSGSAIQADVLLDEVVQHAPTLEALGSRAEFARDRHDWPGAVAAQQVVLAAKGDSATASDLCRLGGFYVQAGNDPEAEAWLRRGLRKDPYSFLCHRDLGELLRTTDHLTEAEEQLNFVVRFFPTADATTYLSLALAYRQDRRRSAAQRTLEKGRRMIPGDALLRRFELPR